MATFYLWSGATGAGTGADWANAFTTIDAAIAATTLGNADLILMAHDHVDISAVAATRSLTVRGSEAAPGRIIVVNRTTGVPVTEPSAIVGVSGNFGIYLAGCMRTWGIIWQPGSGAGSGSGERIRFANATGNTQRHGCGRIDFSAVNNGFLEVPSAEGRVVLGPNFQIAGGNGNRNIRVAGGATLLWYDSTPWAAAPNNLIDGAYAGEVTFLNCNLLNCGGKNLYAVLAGYPHRIKLKNCDVPSTLVVPAPVQRDSRIIFENSTDELGNIINRRHYLGGVVAVTPTTFRTGGASSGTANISVSMAGNANASRTLPISGPEHSRYIKPPQVIGSPVAGEVGAPITVTVHVISDVTLKDDECWLVVENMATAGSTKGTRTSDGPAHLLSVGADQAADASANWTAPGIGSPVKQKLEVTVTPQQDGDLRYHVQLARNAQIYYCPKLDIA